MMCWLKKFVRGLGPKDLLWIALVALIVLLFRQCSAIDRLEAEKKVGNQNLIALADTIHTERQKSGTVNAYRAVMLADMEQLRLVNNSLASKIDSLRRVAGVKGTLVSVQNTGVNVNSGPLEVEAEVLYVSPSGDVRLTLALDTTYSPGNSRLMEGSVDFHIDSMTVTNPTLTLTRDELRMALSTGVVRDKDGTYKIFVSTDYPGVTVTRLDGALLDPSAFVGANESSVVIGPQVGLGWSFGSPAMSPYVGFGATYNLNKQVKGIFKK